MVPQQREIAPDTPSSAQSWPETRDRAIRVFGSQKPGVALDVVLGARFEREPARVVATLEDVAVKFAAGGIVRPWGIVRSRLDVDPARELDAERLLSTIGRCEPATADVIRSFAVRAPEALLARIRERLTDGDVRDRAGYTLGALRRELAREAVA